MKVVEIKESEGIKLYRFDKIHFTLETLKFTNKGYKILDRQFGKFFKIKDIVETTDSIVNGDEYELVGMAAFDIKKEDYINVITELEKLIGKESVVKIDEDHQTAYIKCTDTEWKELFETACVDRCDKSISSNDYDNFYSTKFIRLIRVT